MTALLLNPFPMFYDQLGQPLDEGYIYVGEANKDPRQFPINVYLDVAKTNLAIQPLRTTNGIISNGYKPIPVFTDLENYSVLVLDKYGKQVFYDKSSVTSNFGVTDALDYIQQVTNNAELTAQQKFDAIDAIIAESEGIADQVAASQQARIDDMVNTGLVGAGSTDLLVALANGRSQRDKNADTVSIKDHGAIGDGTLHAVQEWITSGKYNDLAAIQVDYPHVTALTDSIDWAAIVKAVIIGSVHNVPSGTYVLNKGVDLTGGGFIGSGSGYSAASTTFKFIGGVTGVGAITTKISTARNRPTLKDLNIVSANWDAGLQCNGLDIEAPAFIENVYVEKFYEHGLFLHNDTNGSGPYETYIRNVRSLYNRMHGAVIGTGANAVTLINYEGKWNGSPSFGVAPTAQGNYDGLFISNTGDGNPSNTYYAYVPEALTIIGGDCSYNSRYGWNIDVLKDSSMINPAYAEHNIVKQARIGNFTQCSVNFAVLSGGLSGLQNDLNYSPYYSTNRIFVAGRQLLLGDINYNYTALAGATSREYLSTSLSGSDITWISKNQMPDSTLLADSGFATVTTLSGFGSYALALGSGSNFLKISNNEIRIPLTYKRATAGGWNASSALRTMLSNVPSSGTYSVGDYVEKINPTKDGNNFVKGWLRVTTGTNHVLGTDWIEDKVQLLDYRTGTATSGATTLAANAVRSFTVSFARAISVNDHFSVTSRGDRQGTIVWAEFLDANTVTVYQYNPTAAAKTLATMVFEVRASS